MCVHVCVYIVSLKIPRFINTSSRIEQVPSSLAFQVATDNIIIILFDFDRDVSTQWLLSGHNVRSVCTVWSYVCSVCTERTVLLVPRILLGTVDVLVPKSKWPRPERGQIGPSKLLSQHFCCSNNCMYMSGCVYGRPVWGLF